MKKENYKRLCKKCKAIFRSEDTENKRAYRLKIKDKGQTSGKVKINEKTN